MWDRLRSRTLMGGNNNKNMDEQVWKNRSKWQKFWTYFRSMQKRCVPSPQLKRYLKMIWRGGKNKIEGDDDDGGGGGGWWWGWYNLETKGGVFACTGMNFLFFEQHLLLCCCNLFILLKIIIIIFVVGDGMVGVHCVRSEIAALQQQQQQQQQQQKKAYLIYCCCCCWSLSSEGMNIVQKLQC